MSQPYEFMRDRLEDQSKYYSKQSAKNKKKYFSSQTIIIVLGIIIPIVNIIAISNFATTLFLIISTILASVIALTAALSQLNKHYEIWLNYRRPLELLKREKSLYQNSAGGYFNLNEIDKKRVFVEMVEELSSSEHTKFFSSFQQQMDSLQYVKDILAKVNDLRSLDVTNSSKVSIKGESADNTTSIANPEDRRGKAVADTQQQAAADKQQQQTQKVDTTANAQKKGEGAEK